MSKDNFYKVVNKDKTEEIGISLTEQEVSNLFKLILETAKNDTTLLNLIINKAQLLNYNNVTIVNIQSLIQENIDEISSKTYLNDRAFLKISLIKNNEKVIKLNIETNSKQVENIESNQIFNNKIEIDFSEENKLSVVAKENDIKIIKFILNYSYNESNINYYMEIESKEDEEVNIIKTQYQINNYQSDNIAQKCIIDFEYKEEKYQVNIVNNITLKEDVIISKLTTENSAKLNYMTSEELEQLYVALINRITTVYGGAVMENDMPI